MSPDVVWDLMTAAVCSWSQETKEASDGAVLERR